MFKPLLRLTLVHILWRNYKRHLITTGIALIAIVVISLIHSDYLEYAQQQPSNHFIGWSFVIKWLLYFLVCLVWAVTVKGPDTKSAAPSPDSVPSSPKNSKKNANNEPDPFDFLRHKPKLTSRAEQVIQDKKP